MAEDPMKSGILYNLEDRPPTAGAAFAGFQHLLAMFGGILTAPLLVAIGMGDDGVISRESEILVEPRISRFSASHALNAADSEKCLRKRTCRSEPSCREANEFKSSLRWNLSGGSRFRHTLSVEHPRGRETAILEPVTGAERKTARSAGEQLRP